MRLFVLLLLVSYTVLYPLCILRNTVKFGQQGKDWNGLCKIGKKQSPLNLENNVLRLPKNILTYKYDTVKGTSKWNGSFYRIDVEGNSNSLTFLDFYSGKSQKYILKRIIIRTPSEHQIKGKKFDSEIQFVHLAEKSKLKNDLTIVSVMVSKDMKKQDKFFKEFKLEGASTITSLQSIFDGQDAYYFYEGSQTIPVCCENVNWIVFEKPILASSSNVTSLNLNFGVNFPFGNARAVQNLNGRNVFRFSKSNK
jgi:carbonic anhydrase